MALRLGAQFVSLKTNQQYTNSCDYQEAYYLGHMKNKATILQQKLRDWARTKAVLPKIFELILSTDGSELGEFNEQWPCK